MYGVCNCSVEKKLAPRTCTCELGDLLIVLLWCTNICEKPWRSTRMKCRCQCSKLMALTGPCSTLRLEDVPPGMPYAAASEGRRKFTEDDALAVPLALDADGASGRTGCNSCMSRAVSVDEEAGVDRNCYTEAPGIPSDLLVELTNGAFSAIGPSRSAPQLRRSEVGSIC